MKYGICSVPVLRSRKTGGDSAGADKMITVRIKITVPLWRMERWFCRSLGILSSLGSHVRDVGQHLSATCDQSG